MALQPDATVGTYSGMSQDEYDTLSRIAPPMSYLSLPVGASWQEVTLTMGRILGKAATAHKVLAA